MTFVAHSTTDKIFVFVKRTRIAHWLNKVTFREAGRRDQEYLLYACESINTLKGLEDLPFL